MNGFFLKILPGWTNHHRHARADTATPPAPPTHAGWKGTMGGLYDAAHRIAGLPPCPSSTNSTAPGEGGGILMRTCENSRERAALYLGALGGVFFLSPPAPFWSLMPPSPKTSRKSFNASSFV